MFIGCLPVESRRAPLQPPVTTGCKSCLTSSFVDGGAVPLELRGTRFRDRSRSGRRRAADAITRSTLRFLPLRTLLVGDDLPPKPPRRVPSFASVEHSLVRGPRWLAGASRGTSSMNPNRGDHTGRSIGWSGPVWDGGSDQVRHASRCFSTSAMSTVAPATGMVKDPFIFPSTFAAVAVQVTLTGSAYGALAMSRRVIRSVVLTG